MNEQQRNVALMEEALVHAEGPWLKPTPLDCSVFYGTEIAELITAIVIKHGVISDNLLRMGLGDAEYARNSHKEPDIEHELGDMQLMLCILANRLEVDLDVALQKRVDGFLAKLQSGDLPFASNK